MGECDPNLRQKGNVDWSRSWLRAFLSQTILIALWVHNFLGYDQQLLICELQTLICDIKSQINDLSWGSKFLIRSLAIHFQGIFSLRLSSVPKPIFRPTFESFLLESSAKSWWTLKYHSGLRLESVCLNLFRFFPPVSSESVLSFFNLKAVYHSFSVYVTFLCVKTHWDVLQPSSVWMLHISLVISELIWTLEKRFLKTGLKSLFCHTFTVWHQKL